MKFKNYIETESGIKDTSVPPEPGTVGTAGQVLSSTVTGTSWIDQGEIVAAAATVVAIECKNTHTTPLTKGTPVYQTGTVGATDVIEIAPGNALVSTGAQPSIGLLQQDLAINEFGYVIITGELLNITTDPIDGLTPVTGQKVFVKSGGGLTLTKPTTELNSIQNMGLVGKVSGGNAGSITVSSIMRTNDVPNLPTGRIWVGDGNTIVSDTVYVDELNGRVGIGVTSPQEKLHVSGSSNIRLEVEATDSTVAALKLTNTAGSYGSFVNASGSLNTYDYNAASVRTTLLTNGNFGIGTTTPSAKLHVAGNTYIQNNLNIQSAISSAPAYGYPNVGAGQLIVGGVDDLGIFSPSVITLINQDTTINAGQDLGVLQFVGKDDASSGYCSSQIIGTVSQAPGSGNSGGGILRFLTNPGGTGAVNTEKMRIISSGNVGIGTTNPLSKLHVVASLYGPIDYTNRCAILGLNDSTDTFYANSIGVAGRVKTSDGRAIYGEAQGGGWGGYFDGKGFFSNNVGIGITNPQTKLHLGTDSTSGSTTEELKIQTGTSSGFGGTAKLWLKTGQYGVSTINMGREGSFGTSGGFIQYDDFSSDLSIGANFGTKMVIDGVVGNVGIGATSPSQKLHVVGSGYFQNGNVFVGSTSNTMFNYISTFVITAGSGQIIALGGGPGNVNNNVLIGNGDLKVNGSVQLANDTDIASAAKVGTFKYYTSGNNSYVDMCMQTGASTYAWVNIVTNSW